jgi:lathosterol oxidase
MYITVAWAETTSSDKHLVCSLSPGQLILLGKRNKESLITKLTYQLRLSGTLLYSAFASISYIFVFDKANFKHPKFLENQVSLEIKQALAAIPVMALLTVPFFIAELHGYSYIYHSTAVPAHSHWLLDTLGWRYNYLQVPLFIGFTDCGIYWMHRALHSKLLYKRLHKPHHKWIVPTPFASHSFHPIDGFLQSIPYHLFAFIFPLHRFAYLGLFTFVQVWTVMIHDGRYIADSSIINGTAHHSIHHLYFNYNYGQFFTLWDRLGGSHRRPSPGSVTLEDNIVMPILPLCDVNGNDGRARESQQRMILKGKKAQ